MTRDEAINIWEGFHYGAGSVIDGFVALGMLKLDEPKGIEERLHDAMKRGGGASFSAVWLMMALDCSGLKLVEK